MYDLPDRSAALTLLSGRLERADTARGWPVRPDRPAALTRAERTAVYQWLRDKQLPELPSGTVDRPPDDPQLTDALAVLRDALTSKTREPAGGK